MEYDFLKEKSFLQRFPARVRKKIESAIMTLDSFLPKKPGSPWPGEIRGKMNHSTGMTALTAFDGTIGASITLGPVISLYLTPFTRKWAAGLSSFQAAVLEKVIRPGWTEKVLPLDVRELSGKYAKLDGIRTSMTFPGTGYTFVFNTQDIMRLCAEARKLRAEQITLYGISYLYDTRDTAIVHFSAKYINFHILAEAISNYK